MLKGILGLIQHPCRLVETDVFDAQHFHRREKRFAGMSECDGRMVREPFFDQHVPVEPAHVFDGENADAAERFGVDVEDFALRDI